MTTHIHTIDEQVYCSKREDGFRIHELVEEVDWKYGKIVYRCMWCNELIDNTTKRSKGNEK